MPKKQIKVTFLLIIVILLTGCNAEYNLIITDNEIIESTNFYVEDNDLVSTNGLFSSFDEMVDYYYIQDYDVFYNNTMSNTFYKKNKISDNSKLGINLMHNFSFKDFVYSNLLNYKYKNMKYKVSKNDITIDINDFSSFYEQSVGDEFNALNFNTLTINIKTDLKVLDNNADSVNGNVYTWSIDINNARDKSLYIKMRKGISQKDRMDFTFIFVILVILVVLVIVLLFYIFKKKKESNEI